MKKIKKLIGIIHGNRVSDLEPKGVHHSISYAESFADTWLHIFREIKKL